MGHPEPMKISNVKKCPKLLRIYGKTMIMTLSLYCFSCSSQSGDVAWAVQMLKGLVMDSAALADQEWQKSILQPLFHCTVSLAALSRVMLRGRFRC